MAASASAQIVDFSNVKEGGNFNKKRLPAGDYLAKITKVEDAESKQDKVFQYLVSIQIVKHSQSVFPYYCKLTENQLWKLRNLLIAAGKTVPKKRFKVDINSVVGKQIGVTLEDDEYDGKEQSTISAVFPAAELADLDDDADEPDEDEDADEEAEEEEPEAEEEAEEEPDEEEEAEDEADEFEALDRNQLKALVKAADPAHVFRKSETDDDLRAILRSPAGDEEEAEEEEEEAPAPVAKKKLVKKPAAKKKSADVDDDELDELDIDAL